MRLVTVAWSLEPVMLTITTGSCVDLGSSDITSLVSEHFAAGFICFWFNIAFYTFLSMSRLSGHNWQLELLLVALVICLQTGHAQTRHFNTLSIWREVHSVFQSDFSRECDVVRTLSIPSTFSFPCGNSVTVWVFPSSSSLTFLSFSNVF